MSLLTRETLQEFHPVKSFLHKQSTAPITTISFDSQGQFILATQANETMHLYDAYRGMYIKPIYSKKYGCHSAKFTHSQKECIYASTKGDSYVIRHLSLQDNQYIRYFEGHSGLVSDIAVSPLEDIFLSSSYDESVRLWDFRASKHQGIIPSIAPSQIAFDPTGLAFAVSTPSTHQIGLYDPRKLNEPPFSVFDIPRSFQEWSKIEFSNDGKHILLSSQFGKHLVIDAYSGKVQYELNGAKPFPYREFPDSGNACFSPDGRFVVGGGNDGKVSLWDVSTANQPYQLNSFASIQSPSDSKPRQVVFNPKYNMFVTGDEQLDFYTV